MGPKEGDFHRTRLTHTIEVAQIGQGIATRLHEKMEGICLTPKNTPHQLTPEEMAWLPCRDIIEASCYAHDLGHPPYGHDGETTLHCSAQSKNSECAFEANAQTIRIITQLEQYHKAGGINPTRRTLLSVLKYPTMFKIDNSRPSASSQHTSHNSPPPKCYYEAEQKFIEWATEPLPHEDIENFLKTTDEQRPNGWVRTIDASIMDIADEIAYSTHDFEDAIESGLLNRDYFCDKLFSSENNYQHNREKASEDYHMLGIKKNPLPEFNGNDIDTLFGENIGARKQFISCLTHAFILAVYLKIDEQFTHPLLRFQCTQLEGINKIMSDLRKIVYGKIIETPVQQMIRQRGNMCIRNVFNELCKRPQNLIPHWLKGENRDAEPNSLYTLRQICDYIAQMTDARLATIYSYLFTPNFGTSRDAL